MKTRSPNLDNEVVTSEGLEGKSFGIRDEDLGFILSILRDGLYEDPIGSICREIISNCVDAHTEAGIPDKPIEIYLPSVFESSIKFVDHGKGMSPEFIDENYRNFGASSKCYSDDVIGGFGIGSKSPWSYSDSFTVTTIWEGSKYVYSCYLDESERGKIFLLSEEETNESSGTTITIPVKSKDISTFTEKVKYYSRYLPVTPIITPKQDVNKRKIFLSGDNWEIYNDSGYGSVRYLVVSGIPYPINFNSLPQSAKDRSLENISFAIFCDVKDVDVATNREALKYKDKTIDFIKASFDKMKKELVDICSKELDQCATYKEAVLKWDKTNYGIRSLLPSNPSYKGKKISSSICISCSQPYTVQSFTRLSNNTTRLINDRTLDTFRLSSKEAIILNNLATSTDRNYVASVFDSDSNINTVYVIRGNGVVLSLKDLEFKERSQILASAHTLTAEDIELILMSSVTPKVRVKTKAVASTSQSSTPSVKKPKGHLRVLKFDGSLKRDYSKIGVYQFAEEVIIDPKSEKGYYIKVDKGSSEYFGNSNALLSHLSFFNLTSCYLVRKKEWEMFDNDSNWIDFEKYLDKEASKYLTDNFIRYNFYSNKYGRKIEDKQTSSILKENPDSLFSEYLSLLSKCESEHESTELLPIYQHISSLFNKKRNDYAKDKNYLYLENLYDRIKSRYPLLFSSNIYFHHINIAHINHYIKLIEDEIKSQPNLKLVA